jgi:hypothetical protein
MLDDTDPLHPTAEDDLRQVIEFRWVPYGAGRALEVTWDVVFEIRESHGFTLGDFRLRDTDERREIELMLIPERPELAFAKMVSATSGLTQKRLARLLAGHGLIRHADIT